MKKILVVEDDRFLANAYQIAFSQAGFEVELLFDGEKVVDTVQVIHPDVIILDLLLPLRDGFSVLEELKRTSATKNIPVLIASNLGQQNDIQRGLSLGASDYVVKSDTSIIEVVEKTRKLLGQST